MQTPTWIPLFSFVAEVTLRRDNKAKYDHCYVLSHNVNETWETVNHHCRHDISEGWTITMIQFSNFQFISGHNYINYVK